MANPHLPVGAPVQCQVTMDTKWSISAAPRITPQKAHLATSKDQAMEMLESLVLPTEQQSFPVRTGQFSRTGSEHSKSQSCFTQGFFFLFIFTSANKFNDSISSPPQTWGSDANDLMTSTFQNLCRSGDCDLTISYCGCSWTARTQAAPNWRFELKDPPPEKVCSSPHSPKARCILFHLRGHKAQSSVDDHGITGVFKNLVPGRFQSDDMGTASRRIFF